MIDNEFMDMFKIQSLIYIPIWFLSMIIFSYVTKNINVTFISISGIIVITWFTLSTIFYFLIFGKKEALDELQPVE